MMGDARDAGLRAGGIDGFLAFPDSKDGIGRIEESATVAAMVGDCFAPLDDFLEEQFQFVEER